MSTLSTKASYQEGGVSGSGDGSGKSEVVFSEEIGLAIEKLPNGVSLE